MEITTTVRVTADARINETKGGRKVVNFSVAHNDRYTVKGTDEVKEITTFLNCAYWHSTAIAQYLTKGKQVEIKGNIGVNAWKNASGEAKAALTMMVGKIKLLDSRAATPATPSAGLHTAADNQVEFADDLPF